MMRSGSPLSRFSQLAAFFAVFAASSAHAITIDQFNGELRAEDSIATFGPTTAAGAFPSAIGGARTLQAIAITGPLKTSVSTENGADMAGYLSHSQESGVKARSTVIWDGDTNAALNPIGLGGIDLTEDGGTALELGIFSFDLANGNPIALRLSVFDASDPSGQTASVYELTINNKVENPQTLFIPFASFTLKSGAFAPASFKNLGALVFEIDGNSPDLDLSLEFIKTNGRCPLVPGKGGKVLDVCGVCGGDGTSCLDCRGVPFGKAAYDQCGVCAGDGKSCLDCSGTPNGNAAVDSCGVCGGDGRSCIDCRGYPFGTAALDRCGVCDGDGGSCIECSETNLFDTLRGLDGGAKKLESAIKAVLNQVAASSRNEKVTSYVTKTKDRAHELQLRNWGLSWTIPVISRSCTGMVELCARSSNLPIVSEYRQHNLELLQILRGAVKRLRKVRGSLTRSAELWLKKGERIYLENEKLADSVPLDQFSC